MRDYNGNPVEEYLQFYGLGIDGVFSDFADTAVAARALSKFLDEPGFARCLTEGPNKLRSKLHDCFNPK